MNQGPDRNRPVFRPQGQDVDSEDVGASAESSSYDETKPPAGKLDGDDANSPVTAPSVEPSDYESTKVDLSKESALLRARTKESASPATPEKVPVAEAPEPGSKSAFTGAGRGMRGRMRSISDTAVPGASSEGSEGSTRGRDEARFPSSRMPASARPGEGDTVPSMPSVAYDAERGRGGAGGRTAPAGRAPSRPGGGGRSVHLPKPRRYAGPVPGRFGFIGFVFGLIGLVIRMIIVTLLVGGIIGGASYVIIQWYVKTPEVTVPSVRGMRIQEAFDTLSNNNLGMVRERAEPSALFSPGEVIEQRPAPLTKTKSGSTVQLVVSSGKSNFVVPDVRGETRDTALNKIKGAQLEVGNITFLADEKIGKDLVIQQNPEAGKGLDSPTKVDLLLSSGPAGSSLKMPEVTNLTVAEAKEKLRRLEISDVSVEPADAGDAAVVTGQTPLVGKYIYQADKIILQARK